MAPWRAAGIDGIPAAAYKFFPSAVAYVKQFVSAVLRGETQIAEADVRARVCLIHKSGDTNDPANYRPIAVLNSEYKLLTAVIAAMIQENLAPWMIPKERLSRNGTWGTVQGLLWDKSCTLSARLSRRNNYSLWYDFQRRTIVYLTHNSEES